MNLTTTDGQLFFADPFGLTRMRSPKEVKTSRTWLNGLLSQDEACEELLSWTVSKQARLFVDTLKTSKKYAERAFFQAQLHPAGGHLSQYQNELREPAALEVYGLSAKNRHSAQVGHYVLEHSSPWPEAQLSERAPVSHFFQSTFRWGPERRFLAFCRHNNVLFAGHWPDATCAPTIAWSWPVRIHQGTVLTLDSHPTGDVVLTTDAKTRRAVGVRIVNGERIAISVPAVKPPVSSGEHLFFQPDDEHVVLRPFGGGEDVSIALSKLPKHRELSNVGPATLLFHGERPMVVPWHSESFIDVHEQLSISRKLPAAQREFRLAAGRLHVEYIALGRAAGVAPTLESIEVTKTSYRLYGACTDGDRTLAAQLASQQISDMEFRPELVDFGLKRKVGAVGHVSSPLEMVDVEQVRDAFELCDAHKISLCTGLDEYVEPQYRRVGLLWARTLKAVCTPEAACILFRAMVADLCKPGSQLLPQADLWAGPLTAEDAIQGLRSIVAEHGCFIETMLMVLVDALGAQARPILEEAMHDAVIFEAICDTESGMQHTRSLERFYIRYPDQRTVTQDLLEETSVGGGVKTVCSTDLQPGLTHADAQVRDAFLQLAEVLPIESAKSIWQAALSDADICATAIDQIVKHCDNAPAILVEVLKSGGVAAPRAAWYLGELGAVEALPALAAAAEETGDDELMSSIARGMGSLPALSAGAQREAERALKACITRGERASGIAQNTLFTMWGEHRGEHALRWLQFAEGEFKYSLIRLVGEAHVTESIPLVIEAIADEQLRWAAVAALGKMGVAEAVAHVRPLLDVDDRDLQCRAGVALAQMGETDIVEQMRRNLSEDEENCYYQASIALGALGDPAAIPELLSALEQSCSGLPAQALMDIGGTAVVPAFLERAATINVRSLGTAAEVVVAHLREQGDEPAREALMMLLAATGEKGHYEDMRGYAAEALGALGERRAMPLIRELLTSRGYIQGACTAVALLGDHEAVPGLIGAFSTPLVSEEDIIASITALPPEETLPLLRKALNRRRGPVLRGVVATLAAMDTPESIAVLESGYAPRRRQDLREAIVEGLETTKRPEALSVLDQALNDSDINIVNWAARAMKGIPGAQTPVRVAALLEKLRTEGYQSGIAHTLAAWKVVEAVPLLLANIGDENGSWWRTSVLECLAEIGHESAIPVVRPFLQPESEADDQVRAQAVTTLSCLGGANLDEILRAAQDSSGYVRSAAVAAMKRQRFRGNSEATS